MIGVFSFDGPFYKDKNNVYCSVTLTNEMFSRYFPFVDKMYAIVRTYHSDKTYQELNMKPLTAENIEVVEAPNFADVYAFWIKKQIFRKEMESLIQKADLLFLRMPSLLSNMVADIARKQSKPYLVEVGGCPWDSYWNHGIKGKLVAPYMFFMARKSIRNASFATYVTKEFLQKRYPNKQKTINCSNVYIIHKENSVLQERLTKIQEMDFKHPVIGQIAALIDVKYKGEHLVIQALSILKKQNIYPTFEIVGPGSGVFLRKVAKKYGVENQVKFVGTLTKQEIDSWCRRIDLYIQPSKQEGLPRSMIEAMSNACPALGSTIAGIPELIGEECLFDPDKIKMIADKIAWILSPDEMQRQARRNFEVSKEYELDILEARRKSVFSEYKSFIQKKD